MQARIHALETQLASVRALRHGGPGSLRSPPLSAPRYAGSIYKHGIVEGPQDGVATQSGVHPESDSDAGLPGGSFVDAAPKQSAPCSLPNKENTSGNTAASKHGTSRARQACKEEWDEERSELLSLLERLQAQLEAHAQHQAATAHDSPVAPMHGQNQPVCAGDDREPCSQLPVSTPVAAQQQQHESDIAVSSPSIGTTTEASFDSPGRGADAASPAAVAHHMMQSPLLPTSASRSGAPSPPSVRPLRHAAAPPAAETWQAGSGEPTPSSQAFTSEPVPQQDSTRQNPPEEHAHQQHKVPGSGRRTLDAFFGRSRSEVEAAAGRATAAGQAVAEENSRLQQAEQRAAELEVGRRCPAVDGECWGHHVGVHCPAR